MHSMGLTKSTIELFNAELAHTNCAFKVILVGLQAFSRALPHPLPSYFHIFLVSTSTCLIASQVGLFLCEMPYEIYV